MTRVNVPVILKSLSKLLQKYVFISAFDQHSDTVLFNLYHSLSFISRRQNVDKFFFIFPRKTLWYFMQIVSLEDNLREMPNPLFSEKKKKSTIFKRPLLISLPSLLSVNWNRFTSRKLAYIILTPYTPLLLKTGIYRGIHYFSYFCSKHRLWVLVRTTSMRRF